MKNWKNLTHVYTKTLCGKVTHYETLEDAVRGTGWYAISRMLEPRQTPQDIYDYGYRFSFYSDGIYIPHWKIKEVCDHIGLSYYTYRRRNKFKFRNGPVDGIGGRRRYCRGRNVQTTQERRENDFNDRFDEDAREYGIKARPGRSAMMLPNSWDDWPHWDSSTKNWKSFRKTQWKD